MQGRKVQVAAGSRLHFGMLSFGDATRRQYAGVGAMIDAPGVRLSLAASERTSARGPAAQRVLAFARQFMATARLGPGGAFGGQREVAIEVEAAPPEHAGLGSGTSLGMAVALGLNALAGGPLRTPAELARSVGRGRRSAIGVHGALVGGFLVDGGKWRQEELSPLVCRVELPASWRFVLLRPRDEKGLSGAAEQAAFEQLPAVPLQTSAALSRRVLLELLPAAASGDLADFGESLYEFGRAAGECFSAQQGGIYCSDRAAGLIEQLRGMGIRGVGQSSWGPTLFALTGSDQEANELLGRLGGALERMEAAIAAPLARGATMQVQED